MIGLGTIINTISIILGGLVGHFFCRLLKDRHQKSLAVSCGISAMFIGIAGAMQGMLTFDNGHITSGMTMFVTICFALGTFIGEIIDIEGLFENFG